MMIERISGRLPNAVLPESFRMSLGNGIWQMVIETETSRSEKLPQSTDHSEWPYLNSLV
jgi:hypothetical protein